MSSGAGQLDAAVKLILDRCGDHIVCGIPLGLGLALAVDFSTISITGVAWAFASALFVTVMILLMVDMSTKVGGVTTNFHMSFWNLLLFTCILILFQNVQ